MKAALDVITEYIQIQADTKLTLNNLIATENREVKQNRADDVEDNAINAGRAMA